MTLKLINTSISDVLLLEPNVYDDSRGFFLETFQAGLSWITILRRRENFRTAFDNFDFHERVINSNL